MSLQVWLPLTKDLRQQGLLNVTVTNNGAVFNSVGKLGGCYQTDGSHKIAISSFPWMSMKPSYNFSLFLWVKGTTTGWLIAAGGWELLLRPTFIRIGLSGNGQYPAQLTDTFDSNTWYHLGFTWEGTTGQLKLYLNGLNVATSNVPSTANFDVNNSINLTYDGPRYLNDFRIYDHCLSPMEVKELAKGLILHYPLNRNGWGQNNLLKNSNFLQGTNGMQGYTATSATCTKQTDCMKVVSTSVSGGFYSSNFDSITTGDMTTFSADVKADNNMTIYIGTDGSGNGNCQAYTVGTTWQRISISKAKTTNNANLRIYGNGTFYAKNLKYELGSIATPWCPNSADTIYSILGLNGTIEYDCSGFYNNGTRTGTFTWTSDTPKYNISTKLESESKITMPFTYNIGTNPISIGCWHKINTTGTYNPIFNLGTATSGLTLRGNHLEGGNGSSNFDYTISALQNNSTWHHTMFIYDGTNIKIYQNGELIHTQAAPTVGLGSVSQLQLGKFWATCNSVKTLSDVRIYVTALSAEDVKSLYQNSAYIDSSGNIYGTIHEV